MIDESQRSGLRLIGEVNEFDEFRQGCQCVKIAPLTPSTVGEPSGERDK